MNTYALDVIEKSLDVIEALLIKSIADTVGAFANALIDLATQAYRSRMRASTFTSVMNGMIAAYLREAYIEGLAEGGVDESEMDSGDEKTIRGMVSAQAGYVDGFAQAVIEARSDTDLRDAIDTRIGYWSRSINAAGLAGLNSANANQVVEFGGGSGKETCNTCQSLMGVRHRRSWFVDKGLVPGVPGNCKQLDGSGFDCCGFNCDHELKPVKR